MGIYRRMLVIAYLTVVVSSGTILFRRDLLAATVEGIALMKSQDRQKVLVDGAKKEGKIVFYTGLIVDQVVRPLKEAFEKEYPYLQVDFFRGNSENIAQRVILEYQAKRYDVDVISFGLVFEDNSLRNVFRIAAEKINLQIRVFFLEGLLERSHDLIDNEAGVENYLTFFLCSINKNFLPVLRLHQGNPFNSGRKQISPEKNCARGNDHNQIRNDEHSSINPHLLSSHGSLRDANPTLIWLSRLKPLVEPL